MILDHVFSSFSPFGITSSDIEGLGFSRDVCPILDRKLLDKLKTYKKQVFINSLLLNELKELGENLIAENPNYGRSLQKINLGLKRRLSANFTNKPIAKFLGKLAYRYNPTARKVTDPFHGSGRLLFEMQKSYSHPLSIFGSEIYFPSVLSSLQTLMPLMLTHSTELTIFHSNAFKLQNISNLFDIVVMNPPFTRPHYLTPSSLDTIKESLSSYMEYFEGQMGLHVYSLFLADKMLTTGGTLIAILPSGTFTAKYASGIKKFLLQNYTIHQIIGNPGMTSFSDGSKIRELILIASKSIPDTNVVTFSQIDQAKKMHNINSISQKELEGAWNWLKFIYPVSPQLKVLQSQCLQTTSAHENLLRRGVEMYGPEFFLIPNKTWRILDEKHDTIAIVSPDGYILEMPRSFLKKALRKPSLYKNKISPNVMHYLLIIPPNQESHKAVQEYVARTKAYATPAIKKFGAQWIHHPYFQVQTKSPFTNLAMVDKFGMKTVGTYVHFMDDLVIPTKNFYMFRGEKETLKLLASWFSSSFFLYFFMRSRRIIGRDLGRLQIVDYSNEPLMINPISVPPIFRQKILGEFDKLRFMDLPPISKQIEKGTRKALDTAWSNYFESIDVSIDLQELYDTLSFLF